MFLENLTICNCGCVWQVHFRLKMSPLLFTIPVLYATALSHIRWPFSRQVDLSPCSSCSSKNLNLKKAAFSQSHVQVTDDLAVQVY